jgi:large subunit ribosomal protein L18e
MRTGPSNTGLRQVIVELKKKASIDKTPLWRRVAIDLEKPTRQRRIVNLNKISKCTKDGEIIIVPGKVLGNGALDHKVTVVAWSVSEQAREKIEKSNSLFIPLAEFMQKSPKGKKVRIIG